MNRDKVFILVLNYNGYKDTIECVDSLLNISYENFKIIIIDNKSSDDSLLELKKQKWGEMVEILELDKNYGYAAGNNKGIEYALINGAEYICVLNNDVIVEKDFLSNLVNKYKKNNNIAVIGPAICEYNDSEIIQSTGAFINLKKGQVPPINNGIKIEEIGEKDISCDYIGGACMLFNKNIIEKFGFIPENYFLFFEETEWCYKIKKSGMNIICSTDSIIYHKGSISINKIGGLSKYFMERNLIVFVKRNATFWQKNYFFVYLILRSIKRLIFKKEDISTIKNYLDGLFNKINKKYNFVYIKY